MLLLLEQFILNITPFAIIIIFNVYLHMDQDSSYLLDWLNAERFHQGKTRYLSSFTQLLQQQCLFDILMEMDSIAFEHFSQENPIKKMDTIEKYLQRELGKRLRWSFKQKIGDFSNQENLMEFTKLVCYFCIHSKKKNDFVSRILTLSQSCQRFLMQQMQKMDIKMQNITQIKQIIQQIQYLEQQNEDLKQKLAQMNRVNTQMLELIKQTQVENKTMKKQIEEYRKQKYEVFEALEIDKITHYLQAYNDLKKQNERSLSLLKQFEVKLEQSEENHKFLEQRIKSDNVVISSLGEQITRLKQIISQYQYKHDCSEWLGPSSNSKRNILKSAASNKQNMSKCSTSLGKSMQVPAQWLSFNDNEQCQTQKSFIRVHNHELMSNLQQMYKKYNSLNNETSELRQKNEKLVRKNKEMKSIIKQVQYAQKQFQFKYQASIDQSNRLIKQGKVKIHA